MDLEQLARIVGQGSWHQRLDAVRGVPHNFAGREHTAAYASAAGAYYADQLVPHFHLVPWPEKYTDHPGFLALYDQAARATTGFTQVGATDLSACMQATPATIRIFRLMAGYSVSELAEAVKVLGGVPVSSSVIERLEGGGRATAHNQPQIIAIAKMLHSVIAGTGGFHIPAPMQAKGFRAKTDKPDTAAAWSTVADGHARGVSYAELLYQRFYGGAFRQLQDAGGRWKGDILEDAVEDLFTQNRVPYMRSVPGTQATIGSQFGITVRPAPDFVIHDGHAPRGSWNASQPATAAPRATRHRASPTYAARRPARRRRRVGCTRRARLAPATGRPRPGRSRHRWPDFQRSEHHRHVGTRAGRQSRRHWAVPDPVASRPWALAMQRAAAQRGRPRGRRRVAAPRPCGRSGL